ncbi:WSC domain-containing protein 1-like [Dreissena polymorpha]|uniref:Sulfotransferase domain-containing protein n=1 Tax=Dreissena polymorpha TaxID=45954 RepID=A0A9D4ICG7_DREPO|nr:WSC domain-containing protein 1-like [Dreissena polymorpha]KAH3768740.1 hypothetical protein DPMN_169957 [Dreissena polymorpha]
MCITMTPPNNITIIKHQLKRNWKLLTLYCIVSFILSILYRSFIPQEGDSASDKVTCTRREVKLSPTILSPPALVSFPGSGSTWVRHMVQQMTGIATVSVYCDLYLYKHGFPYECRVEKAKYASLVKTHEIGRVKKYTRAVLLLRNPYDALLSYFNFVKAGHKGHPTEKALRNASAELFDFSLNWYMNLIKETIEQFGDNVHVIVYERLRDNPRQELTRLARYLDVIIADRDLTCAITLAEESFRRQTKNKNHHRMLEIAFDWDKMAVLDQAIRDAERMLEAAYKRKFDLSGKSRSVNDQAGKDDDLPEFNEDIADKRNRDKHYELVY